MVGPIGDMLGADRVIATRMEVEDGKYTGEHRVLRVRRGEGPRHPRARRLEGYDLEHSYAYSDSVTDVPMLEAVGHPHAVNPDRELRRIASSNGWPVLVFTKPVALRSRVTFPPARQTLAALAVGGAVAFGGVMWASARRRRLA